MLKIYFDNVLIDDDSYTALSNDYKLFTDSFKLGSVACNSFKLSVNKSMVSSHPNEVKIEDDNTTFYLVVDNIEKEKYVYNYTLTDKLVNFNFNYDASSIIQEKESLEETCYLSDIWKDMCSQADVEYDDTYTFLNDIEVNWYDNTIQARKYLSFIATLQGGYACILENGKQSFKPYKKASSKTIDIDECSDFILGEKKTITRVVYDNGVMKWEFGDDTGTTAYIDSTNVFITTEETVENIYDTIVGFEFYLVNVPDAPIDSSIRAGDIITFTDGVNDYPTIAQYSTSYNGGWTGGYLLNVQTKKQEETQIIGVDKKISSIKTIVDRTNATLQIIAQEKVGKDELISSINLSPEEIKILSNKIRLEGYTTINGNFSIDNLGNVYIGNLVNGGYYNLLPNSSGLDNFNKWTISNSYHNGPIYGIKIYDETDNPLVYELCDSGTFFDIVAGASAPTTNEYIMSDEINVEPSTTYSLSGKERAYPVGDYYEDDFKAFYYYIQIIESFHDTFSVDKITNLFTRTDLLGENIQSIFKTFETDAQTVKLKIKCISSMEDGYFHGDAIAIFQISDILLDKYSNQRSWAFNKNDEIKGSSQLTNSFFKIFSLDNITELIKISKGGIYSYNDIKTDGSLTFENDINGITKAELNYLDGVSSNIQTQLNAKFDKAGGTVTGETTFEADLKTNGDFYVNGVKIFYE